MVEKETVNKDKLFVSCSKCIIIVDFGIELSKKNRVHLVVLVLHLFTL